MEALNSYEDILSVCLALRQKVDEAEVELFLFLRSLKEDPATLALIEEQTTFARFVDKDLLVKYSRFDSFLTGLEALGGDEDEVRLLGVSATIHAGRISAEVLPTFQETTKAWSETHNDKKPSYETAGRLVKEAKQATGTLTPDIPGPIKKLTRIQELEKENKLLKAKVKSLELEVKTLKALSVPEKVIANTAEA